jgi:hypothetical protein
MIAVRDIGTWVADAFADPERFIGMAQEIAGDEKTRTQIGTAFRTLGWLANIPIPDMLLRRIPGDIVEMFEWFARDGYHADISALMALQPQLLTLRQWLDQHGNGGAATGASE